MKLEFEQFDQLAVIQISGDFTADDTDRFQRQALEQIDLNVRDFVLDLSESDYLDSAGLEALLWLQDESAQKLGQVRLASLTEQVATILRITRLDKRFDTHDDVDSAVKSLR
ncbi:MAG: STAS domain-containing protein [Planctomycetota bacterium]